MRINQPESPRARPVALVITVALSLVAMTMWFREPDTGALHRARRAVHAVAAPLSAGGEYVTRPVRGLIAWGSDLGVSRSQLEQLRRQNVSLRARVAELEEARLENERLGQLVKLTQPRELESLGARVIGRPTNSWEGVIAIDRGSADGVANGMPVIAAQGLLGQTVEVTQHSAKVRLITDQRSGVAALIQRGRVPGVVKGSIEGGLTLDFVSLDKEVKVGDVVITSGMGGVYPRGIVIGEVESVDKGPNVLYQRVEVQPAGDLAGLEEVLVLIGEPAQAPAEGGE